MTPFSYLSAYGNWIVGVVLFAAALTSVYAVVRENGNPTKTLTWVLLIVMFPVVGILLYINFGLNYRRRKLYHIKKTKDIDYYNQLIEEEYYNFDAQKWMDIPEVRGKKDVAKLLLKSSKSLFSITNDVKVLQDGPDTFEALFEALEKAEKFIHIQYYIFEEGQLADRFLEILTRKIQEGVDVRLLYDSVGSFSLSRQFREKMTAAGIQHSRFLPVRFVQLANKINYRNHRKIVIIDCKVGFTGGINVSDKYLTGDHLGPWRDTFIRIEGNAVNGLQFLFLTDWYFASNQQLLYRKFFYQHENKGQTTPVQIVGSGPDSDYAGVMHQYSRIINVARDYVFIQNPYLIPGEIIQNDLITTALSGVDVRIMIPGVSDFKIVKWSSNSYLEDLLKAGVRIFRYQDGFLHSKVILSDDEICSVGTGNMDIRSFELNFEVNALVFDQGTTQELKDRFMKDCEKCVEVTLEEFQNRPYSQKILESFSRLISPVL
ncbi:cardiolipin synthase [bacterium SCSIO 12741]|nr:cardiolipin synthase [bacterium SCSIO 12741]